MIKDRSVQKLFTGVCHSKYVASCVLPACKHPLNLMFTVKSDFCTMPTCWLQEDVIAAQLIERSMKTDTQAFTSLILGYAYR